LQFTGAVAFLKQAFEYVASESKADLSFCQGINEHVWSTSAMRKVQALLEGRVFDVCTRWGDMLVVPSQRTLDELAEQSITEVRACPSRLCRRAARSSNLCAIFEPPCLCWCICYHCPTHPPIHPLARHPAVAHSPAGPPTRRPLACPPACPPARCRERARFAQASAIKAQLYSAPDAWFTHVYVPLVQVFQPDQYGNVPADVPEHLAQIADDFDQLMDWLAAFHIMKPIIDKSEVRLAVNRLRQAGADVDLGLVDTGAAHIHACNCRDAVHFAWCSHAMAHCLLKKIIRKYPPHIDPTPTASGPGNKHGCIAQATPGSALSADEVGADDPYAGVRFEPREQLEKEGRQQRQPREEEEGVGEEVRRTRPGALDWHLIHRGVTKEVHDQKKAELLQAADSIRNRKPHAIHAAPKRVESVWGEVRVLSCSYRNTARCPARWKEIHHDDQTWSLYVASVAHSVHAAATQKVERSRARARARTCISTAHVNSRFPASSHRIARFLARRKDCPSVSRI
jgi:hypothetical protein